MKNPFVSRDYSVGRMMLIRLPTSEFAAFWAKMEAS
jgi:hypothetical protein